jgi:Lrp/AsnC family transcriptional regulator, regulator for asnA, asnC and gidA
MVLDATNLEIIRHLRNGRKPFRRIADELSVTENTVRARVNRLVDEGVLDVVGLVDPETLSGHRVVFVGVTLSTRDLVRKGEEFAGLRGVVSVSVVTGRYDLILIVLLHDDFDILQFYTDEVSRIDDVQAVETFVVYKGYDLKVPYVL